MTSDLKIVTQPFVNLTIVSAINTLGVEKRYPKDIVVHDLKNKLEMITGFIATNMRIQLLNSEKKFVCDLNDDERMLGFYPAEDGYYLSVDAPQSLVSPVEDPNFKRYELTEEEYAKKRGTVREFKEKMKLGQFSGNAAELAKRKEDELKEKSQKEKELIDAMKVGDRCQVTVPGQMSRLGSVMFIGEIENKPGYWVGVKYDEPLGKNDGTMDGKRYFECQPKYGGFLKPESVIVGDFPEENFDEL